MLTFEGRRSRDPGFTLSSGLDDGAILKYDITQNILDILYTTMVYHVFLLDISSLCRERKYKSLSLSPLYSRCFDQEGVGGGSSGPQSVAAALAYAQVRFLHIMHICSFASIMI